MIWESIDRSRAITPRFSLWEREVAMVGDVAKKTKQEMNTVWIYQPRPERAAALASADPERVTDMTGFFWPLHAKRAALASARRDPSNSDHSGARPR